MTEQTKSQRREHAREIARVEREKNARRAKRRKWIIPSAVSVGILAVVAIVAVVVVTSAPAPQSAAGPRNMASGGITFVGENASVVPVETPGIPANGSPSAAPAPADGVAQVQIYVDVACPACKAFEATYNADILDLVAQGKATYEVLPVAILDGQYRNSRYSSRVNNAAACVANSAPESFLAVTEALFVQQPTEGTTGLTNSEIIDVVRGAGLTNEAVETCIKDETFAPFVLANTQRATGDSALAGAQGFSTPTLVVNGVLWDRSVSPIEFINASIG